MKPNGETRLMGTSARVRDLKQEIARIARSDAKVLVTGETGVGKELVACHIHCGSTRFRHGFVPVNCAGVPETLLESELFGHVKGSFTGAYRDKLGKLELANAGTLFLDEVGEMTLRMQGLLLRVLETGELQKVGADRAATRVDVRVIAATNRDLPAMVAKGQFREDLFYRLNVIQIVVPPLRERREDIPELAEAFLQRCTQANGLPSRTIHPDAMEALANFAWPGNVRQLQNIVERIIVVATTDVITVADLPVEMRTSAPARLISPVTPSNRGPKTAEDLYRRLVESRESFWTAVYPSYMDRDISRTTVRDVIGRGLTEARGSYKIVLQLFNMAPTDYKKFINFLQKHDCQVPFKDYRTIDGRVPGEPQPAVRTAQCDTPSPDWPRPRC